jgi:hypothetical protein
MKLKVEVHDEASPALDRLRLEVLRGLEPIQGQLVDAIHDFWARDFESQGELGGSKWPDLSEATVRRHGAHPVLEDTGSLWASLAEGGSVSGGYGGASRTWGYAVQPDPWSLEVGSTDPVLALTERGTRRMPARPVAPGEVPDAEVERWADIWADDLTHALES